MAYGFLLPTPANDNTRDRHPISFAQAKALASLPSYLRGGRI
jgi:hypothetical protein